MVDGIISQLDASDAANDVRRSTLQKLHLTSV